MLAIAVLLATAACSDAPTAPAGRATPGAPSADLAVASTQLLWNQISLTSTAAATPFSGTLITILADDFVVPAGAEWTVTDVQFGGTLPSSPFTFWIYGDVDGLPGYLVQTYTLAPSSTTRCSACVQSQYVFTLPTPLTLTAGTYWLAAPVAVGGFAWQLYGPVSGSGPAWSVDGGASWTTTLQGIVLDLSFGIYGTARTASSATDDLQTTITDLGLPDGLTTSLLAKLNAALAALNAGDTTKACQLLQTFINEVNALTGKKITQAQATTLINEANAIRALAGC